MVGVDLREQAQLDLLQQFTARYADDYATWPDDPEGLPPYKYYRRNPQFGKVDGEILYGLIRSLRPRRLIEVGGGYSSMLAAQALLRNQAEDPSYACDYT